MLVTTAIETLQGMLDSVDLSRKAETISDNDDDEQLDSAVSLRRAANSKRAKPSRTETIYEPSSDYDDLPPPPQPQPRPKVPDPPPPAAAVASHPWIRASNHEGVYWYRNNPVDVTVVGAPQPPPDATKPRYGPLQLLLLLLLLLQLDTRHLELDRNQVSLLRQANKR